jgi:putative spermidine/putrescine transport system permease protein
VARHLPAGDPGPLLISVVARTLGWALLFGGNSGLVNKALMSLG